MRSPSQSHRRPWLLLSLFVLISCLWWRLALQAAPAMGDAWGNPMQALIQARSHCSEPALACLWEFLRLTAHNDSVKLFPGVLELLHTILIGRWTITASRLLGMGCWMLVLMLLLNAHQRLPQRSNLASTALPFFWLFLFSLSAGLERFATAFAIHRALPALCTVAAASLLWLPLPPAWKARQLPLLGLCCVISLFSFANGGWLFPLVAISLALQRRSQWRWIATLALVSLGPFLTLFKWKHAANMQSIVEPSAAHGLSFLDQFSLWPLRQTLIGLGYDDLLLAIPFALIIAWSFWLKEGLPPLNSTTEYLKYESRNSLGFYGLIWLTYIPVPLLVTLQRGYSTMQSRYYVEAALFSAASAGLVVVLLSHAKLSRARPWAAAAAASLLALNSGRLLGMNLRGDRLKGPEGLTCLQSHPRKITRATVERCGVDQEFPKWKLVPHQQWQIRYARGLNRVLRSPSGERQ